jgi:hypothetical protein
MQMLFRRSDAHTGSPDPVLRAAQPTSAASAADHHHRHLRTLGLKADATWADIDAAYRALVSDLTPGPEADHSRVALARRLLDEVHASFEALRNLEGRSDSDGDQSSVA